jgi:hypothetical protein
VIDHAPPHFHALYAEDEALIDIGTLQVLEGHLPRRAQALVMEWAKAHQTELSLRQYFIHRRKSRRNAAA